LVATLLTLDNSLKFIHIPVITPKVRHNPIPYSRTKRSTWVSSRWVVEQRWGVDICVWKNTWNIRGGILFRSICRIRYMEFKWRIDCLGIVVWGGLSNRGCVGIKSLNILINLDQLGNEFNIQIGNVGINWSRIWWDLFLWSWKR